MNQNRTIQSIFLSIHFSFNRSSRKKWTSAAYGGGGGGGCFRHERLAASGIPRHIWIGKRVRIFYKDKMV